MIPAATPSGWRIEYMSMPGPALSVNSPFSMCGAPMQNSATSRPRCTSPLASGMVLPCSRDRLRPAVHVAVQQIDEAHHHARAALGVLGGPGGLGVTRVFDGSADFFGAGQRAFRLHLAGGGVVDVREAAGRAVHVLPPMKWVSSVVILGLPRDVVVQGGSFRMTGAASRGSADAGAPGRARSPRGISGPRGNIWQILPIPSQDDVACRWWAGYQARTVLQTR